MFTRPSSPAEARKSVAALAKVSGVSSYPPITLGSPALGCTEMGQGATSAMRRSHGSSCFAPKPQFSPMESRLAWERDATKASTVCPDSVRPEASDSVPDAMMGMSVPRSSARSLMAFTAALALRVSKIVSISSTSAPPSMSPRACSR